MMTFKFPLQRVLDVKEKQKQQARQELGTSLKKQQEAEEQMVSLNALRSTVQKRMSQINRGVKISELRAQHHYLSYLDQKIERLQKRLRQTKKEVEKKQLILMERSREEQIWQNWKQELARRHRQAVQKAEQEQLDEIASVRYFRERGPSY